MEDLTRVYVTGGLGNHLNVDKIKRLGLLSQVPSDRFLVLPNAAPLGMQTFFDRTGHCRLERYFAAPGLLSA